MGRRHKKRYKVTIERKINNITNGLRRRGAKGVELSDARAMLQRFWSGHPKLCYLCGKELDLADIGLDHVLPLARGGTHAISNLAVCHKRCNSIKGEFTIEQYDHVFKHSCWDGEMDDHYRAVMARRLYASGRMFGRH